MSVENGAVFEIDGWNGPAPTQLCVQSQADIVFARSIISSEVNQLEDRLVKLEARLKKDSDAYNKVEASKQRPQFSFTIELLEDPASQVSTPTDRSYFENRQPIVAEPVGMRGVDWVSLRYPSKGPVLMIGQSGSAFAADLENQRFDLAYVSAGMGQCQPSPSGFEKRYRSAPSSLANWLGDNNDTAQGSVSFFLIGHDATETDIRLLQWRLSPHQVLVLDSTAPIVGDLANVWDGKFYEMDDCFIFSDPGTRFLKPAAGGGSHIPDEEWPKLSVITVSYNQGRYLEDCLCSVLDQKYPNLEYIVIDAVSTDDSIGILRRYEKRLARLVIEKDNGQSHGLNKGFNLATGELYTWVNSDDMLAPGALKIAALTYMQYGCDLISGGCERITERSDEVTALHHAAIPYMEKVELGFAENLVWQASWEKGDYFFQPEVVFSADIWHRAGGFLKEHLYWAMDWELWIRMAMAGATIMHIPDRIGRSREHPEQKTTSDELYLYQLKNILLEIDDALGSTMTEALDLPVGVPRKWQPVEVAESEYEADIQRRSLFRRVIGLRSPSNLKRAIRSRISPYRLEQLRRFRKHKESVGLLLALRGSLPAQRLSRALELLETSEQNARANGVMVEQLRSENLDLRQHMDNVSAVQAEQEHRVEEALDQIELVRKQAAKNMDEAAAHVSALQLEVERLNKERKKTVTGLEKKLARSEKQTASERDTAAKHMQEASAHVSALQLEIERLNKERKKTVTGLEKQLARSVKQTASERDTAAKHMREASAHVSALQLEINRLKKERKKVVAGLEEELKRTNQQTASERDIATKNMQEASTHVGALQVEVDRLKSAREEAVAALQKEVERSEKEREKAVAALTEQFDLSLQEMANHYQQPSMPDGGAAVGIDTEAIAFLRQTQEQRESITRWVNGLDSQARSELASYTAEFCSTFLFGRLPPDEMSEATSKLLGQGASLFSMLRSIAHRHPELHSSERFRAIREHLKQTNAMPALETSLSDGHEFVIVDIGAEELDFQHDVYLPLLSSQDCLLVRFDPFSETTANKARIKKVENNGSTFRQLTLPFFVGDGEPATFHINRYSPTSSLYEGNKDVTAPFGLLEASLETVEKSPVETRRLDDICKGRSWANSGVDLLKIDVQGGTFPVIANAERTLSQTLVCQLEAEFSEVYKEEILFSSIDQTMRDSDFRLLDLHDPGHLAYNALNGCAESSFHAGRLLWSDVVYVRHLDNLDLLTSEELIRVATILHEVYGKYDVTAECLRVYDTRKNTQLVQNYMTSLS